jgi:hypothetical protein
MNPKSYPIKPQNEWINLSEKKWLNLSERYSDDSHNLRDTPVQTKFGIEIFWVENLQISIFFPKFHTASINGERQSDSRADKLNNFCLYSLNNLTVFKNELSCTS